MFNISGHLHIQQPTFFGSLRLEDVKVKVRSLFHEEYNLLTAYHQVPPLLQLCTHHLACLSPLPHAPHSHLTHCPLHTPPHHALITDTSRHCTLPPHVPLAVPLSPHASHCVTVHPAISGKTYFDNLGNLLIILC